VGESSLANGDTTSEGMLNDIGVDAQGGRRVPSSSRCSSTAAAAEPGACLDIFGEFSVTVSVLGVVRALEQNPELAKACVIRGHEIVSHGYRWIDYGAIPEEVERQHMRLAVEGCRS
jgi:hypothetical protein